MDLFFRIEWTSHSVIISDASKFEKTGTYTFASFKDYDVMITNPVSNKEKELVKDVKEVIYVNADQ